MIYGCDAAFWTAYRAELPAAPERWTIGDAPGVQHIDSRNEPGLSDNPDYIHQGGNSGYQAVGLAHAWGAARIVLLGYDMGYAGTHSHFHGAHAHGLPNPPQDMARWRERFAVVERQHPGLVVNATRGGLLGCFERVALDNL